MSILGESCQTSEDPEVCMSPDSPFAAILEELMNLGGFSRVVAIILQCVSEKNMLVESVFICSLVKSEVFH